MYEHMNGPSAWLSHGTQHLQGPLSSCDCSGTQDQHLDQDLDLDQDVNEVCGGATDSVLSCPVWSP